ncbi:TetR/AcrR family transcriptional regulator [Streptomyces sp. NPDC001443]
MVTASGSRRNARSAVTREAILIAAEQLYAEKGLATVSNRQIGEAAGQGNVTAVNYHFGTRLDMMRAVMTRHAGPVDVLRSRYVAEIADCSDLREWVRCLVRPVTEHLEALGAPSWQARCAAQVLTDPAAREFITEDALTRPALGAVVRGLERCLDGLPPTIRRRRGEMASTLIVYTCADRERDLASGVAPSGRSWSDTAEELEDALCGLLMAPAARTSRAL